MNDNDLRIKIMTEYVSKGMDKAQQHINRMRVKLNTVSKVSKDMTRGYQDMGNQILNSQKHQSSYWNNYMKNNKHATRLTDNFSGKVRNLGEVNEEAFQRLQKPFRGYAMSIMFAGMALQRYSMQLYKFGTKAFQEISHSIEGSTTNSDRLQGSMKYLGFTVGQALEPMLAQLTPIVDKIAEFAEKNPELTAGIVGWGAALGAIFMTGGMGALALDGFSNLYTKIQNSETAMGRFLSKTSGMQQVSAGFGLVYAGKGIKDIINDEVLRGVGELTKSAGFFAYASGNKGAAAAMFAIGAAIEFTDTLIKGGGKLTKDSLARFLVNNSAGAFMINPAVGAAVLTVGVGLTFMGGNFFEKISLLLGSMFGTIATMITTLIETAIYPITSLINTIISLGKSVGLFGNVDKINNYGLTESAWNRTEELINDFKSLNNINKPLNASMESRNAGNTYIIDNITIEDPSALASLKDFTERTGIGQ